MTDLQKSHDELAASLSEIVDQLCRGWHGPTRAQIARATDALAEAAPHIKEPAYAKWAAAMHDIASVGPRGER